MTAKNKSSKKESSLFQNPKIILAAILFLTVIVFSNSIKNDFIFNWDDDVYVMNNLLIKDLSLQGIKNIFTTPYEGHYAPLTTLSWAIEHKFFGMSAKHFHITNLLLHLSNIVLVFYFVLKLSSFSNSNLQGFKNLEGLFPATIVATLFAIHPMHAESVDWITERKDLLYSSFYLFAILFWIKCSNQKNKLSILNYQLSILFFLLSLLSKPMAVTLPVVLILIDYYKNNVQHSTFNIQHLIKYIPFFLLSIIFGLLEISVANSAKAINIENTFNYFDSIFLASYAIVFYLIKLIIPVNLCAFYSFPEKTNNLLPMEYYFAPIVLLLLVFGIYKLKKIPLTPFVKGEFKKEIIFGFLFFLITISVVLQFLPVGGAIVAERYSYIPYIGLFFIFAQIFNPQIFKFENLRIPILVGIILVFSILTFNRNKVWKDAYTLFSDTIENNKSYITYFNLGLAKEFIKKDYKGALSDYEMSTKLKPDYHIGYNNYGIVKGILQDYKTAIIYFDKTISIKPTYAEAYSNRALAKTFLKDFDGAILDYNELIRFNTNNAAAYSKRGNAFFNLNKINEACSDWRKAASLNDYSANEMILTYCK